jgi:SMI1 / KNR4 family (SUKH-1)
MAKTFSDFDMDQFWELSEYAEQEYVGPPLTDKDVAAVEHELGYTLPAFYVALMRPQNGGIPRKTCHRTNERTSWASDHIAISGIFSIGREQSHALGGGLGSRFWIREWGYPAIGVYFADCPSAGHDMICLDYRECGPSSSPWLISQGAGPAEGVKGGAERNEVERSGVHFTLDPLREGAARLTRSHEEG